MSARTPEEVAAAARRVDSMLRNADLLPSEHDALTVLRDHAVATEPGDLASLAGRLESEANIADRPGQLDRLEEIATQVRAHRCAPASPSGDFDALAPLRNAAQYLGDLAGRLSPQTAGELRAHAAAVRLHRCAPAAPPIAVGDTVTTAAELADAAAWAEDGEGWYR